MSIVVMPQLGESVTEGVIVAWRKKPGDYVESDESLCDVSTDKVSFEIPSPSSGMLESVLAAEGETVAVGQAIARLAPADAVVTAAKAAAPEVTPSAPTTAVRPSPLARRLAAEANLDLAGLHGSGDGGRVRKADVLRAIEARGAVKPAPASAPSGAPTRAEGDQLVPFTPARKKIAENMTRAVHVAPHGFISFEVDYSAVEHARARVRDRFKAQEGFGLTYLPFVLRALAEALRAFPRLNASVRDDALILHQGIHIGVAVDLSHQGLLAPVIRNADGLSVTGLARAITDLARRARANRLMPDEWAGGTFTVTNPGPGGTHMSVPIINLPQAGILVTDGVARRPWVAALANGEEALVIRPIGRIGLSMDHRAFDGVYAADFLRALKTSIEQTDWSSEVERG